MQAVRLRTSGPSRSEGPVTGAAGHNPGLNRLDRSDHNHAKLLIPLVRRDVRVVEGARLEIDSGGAQRRTRKEIKSHSGNHFTTH